MINIDPIKPYLNLIKAGLAIVIAAMLFIGGCNHGKRKCEAKQLKAQAAAEKAAVKQEALAPVIAQEARDAVEPQVIERVRIIHDTIKAKPLSCPSYDDGVLDAIRSAETAANHVR